MNKYEKIVLVNGSTYEVVPGGVTATDEALILILLPGNMTLGQIDLETDNPENVARIEVQDTTGEALDIKKGYVYQAGCRKIKDYIVSRGALTADGVTDYLDVTATVVEVTLKKADMRSELNHLKETVDLLVLSNLEG